MDRQLRSALTRLGVDQRPLACAIGDAWRPGEGPALAVVSPTDGKPLAELNSASLDQVDGAIDAAAAAYRQWRTLPPPRRGEFVRTFGELVRRHKQELAAVITWESGKIAQEALGEVQEAVDICEFAVGLSRQLYGKTIACERPGHRLTEYWHPLGPVGVISAFNFPVAVWAWNAAIAWVCGDPIVWKPSEKTPLSAIACQRLAQRALADHPDVPSAITNLIVGDAEAGRRLAAAEALPLISATGSVPMGRAVAETVAKRLGRSLLELGGNNALVVSPAADLELAVRSIVFAAVGTCGQRCTSLRRLIVHESIAAEMLSRLKKLYDSLPIGDPAAPGVLVGPLIDERAAEAMESALRDAAEQGGRIHGGGRLVEGVPSGGAYVRPAIVEIDADAPIVQQETFAPILYLLPYRDLEQAIEMNNSVPQGLSSAIITTDLREAEQFCGPAGSDCGLVNVNMGTSGAEVGGAFGGEKQTGGGRESGSDAWKQYMRRVTSTVNYSDELPLAQGIQFEL